MNAQSEAGWKVVNDIDDAIRKHSEASVLATGASLVIGIQFELTEGDVLQTYRASLRAIRSQLGGAIAEDADRVLAESPLVA